MLILTEKDSIRFWNKVDISGDCWIWTAAKSSKGYGRFKLNGKLQSPHVLSYRMHNEFYDNTLQVCHKCDNPSCINPDHLFLGTRSDNMIDCASKNRISQLPSWVLEKKGENKHISKLTNEQVKEIKMLLKTSIKQVEIAEIYSVSNNTIGDIKAGRTWNHI
jgi:hypothetical protein